MSNRAQRHTEDPSTADLRLDNLLWAIVAVAVGVLVLGASLLGVSYLTSAITHLAEYADSNYYLSGEFRTRGFHANRGVAYPPLVYYWTQKLSLPLASLHLFQLLCVFAALVLFVRRLAHWARCESLARLPACIALAAVGLASSPLLLHHALSIMPDTIAAALILIVIVAVVDGIAAGEQLRWNKNLLLLGIVGLSCSLVRREHAYIVLAFGLTTGALYAALATSSRVRRNVLVHCGGFLACVAMSLVINGAIQRTSPMRDEGSLPMMLVISRFAYGALPSIEPHLEKRTRRLMGDLDELNEHPHKFPAHYRKLLRTAPRKNVEAAVQDVLSKSIEYDWHNFATRFYRDWIRHFVIDISYAMCLPDGRLENQPGAWTYTRTVNQVDSPELVNIWIAASQALFWALLAGALLGARLHTWKLTPQALLGTITIVFLCASFYATITPRFNPRYGLPVAAVEHLTLLTLSASVLLRRKERVKSQ